MKKSKTIDFSLKKRSKYARFLLQVSMYTFPISTKYAIEMRSVYTCRKKKCSLTGKINTPKIEQKNEKKKLRNEKYNGKAQQFAAEHLVIQIKSTFFRPIQIK